tara:strand:- start:36 stop:161 length:126 start_codon:yes stop_codon:yes gene_type:complete
MSFKKYNVYYKDRLLYEETALTRKEAVNKAKRYFYKEVQIG